MANHAIPSIIYDLKEHLRKLPPLLDANEKRIYIANAVGTMLGGSFNVPSTPTNLPANFFTMNYESQAGEILARVNEECPLDLNLALECARNAFCFRYRLVFESNMLFHTMLHLASCTDDMVPTKVRDVLVKVKDSEDGYYETCIVKNIAEGLRQGIAV